MANKFAEAGASIVHGIGNGLSFANDLMDDAKGFAGEVAVKGVTGLGRGLANTIDFAGDVAAGATDMVSGGINAALGTPENASDYSSKEGFLDKAGKHINEGFNQIEDATKSKLGKTFVGEKISDGVGFVGEMVSPMGIVGKAGKGAKIAKEYVQSVKNSPKALAELKALVIKAKNEGREVIQSEVDDVLKKYGKVSDNIASDAKGALDKNMDKNWTGEKFIDGLAENTSGDYGKFTKLDIDEAVGIHGKDKILKTLEDRFQTIAKNEGIDPDYILRVRGKEGALPKELRDVEELITLAKNSSAVSAGTKLMDPKTIRFVEKVANYTPEQLASKSPKIAAMMKAGKFTGEVAVADILRKMSQPEIDAIEKEVNSTDPSNEISDGITLPSEKDFNPSKDSKFNVAVNTPDMSRSEETPISKPDMTRSEEEPTTIDAKKKELQLMKEKNAGTLNASSSVVDLMKMLGANSSQEARKILFEELTSQPYTASAEDNIKLKALVEEMFANGTLSDKIQSFKR